MTAVNAIRSWKHVIIFVALSFLSVLCVWFEPNIGITGIVLLYLMFVVLVAYSTSQTVAWLTTALAFLTINFLFVSPRYTLQIRELSSWIMLGVFLGVTVVINSLLHRLQQQRFSAETAQAQAQFGQRLAESLSKVESTYQADTVVAQTLFQWFEKPIMFMDTELQTIFAIPEQAKTPTLSAIQNVVHSGQTTFPIEDHLGSSYLIMPIEAVPQAPLIMVVGELSSTEYSTLLPTLRLAMQQLSETRKRILAQQTRLQSERLAEEERIKSALLSSIAHDMRTPLTVIMGAANTLEQKTLSQAQHKDLLALIHHQTNYLSQTTENILSLIRIESELSIPMSVESIEELISLVMQHYTHRETKPEIALGNLSPECFIHGNAGLIVQAIINLIENAIKATSAQTKPITLSVQKAMGRICVEVRDYGIGLNAQSMNPSEASEISTHNVSKGLGLSIVKAIMTKHGGSFTLRNAEGGGVSAILDFPAFEMPALGESDK